MKARDKIGHERNIEKSKRVANVAGSREHTRAKVAIAHDYRSDRGPSPCHVLLSCSYAVSKLEREFPARLSEAYPADIVPPQPLPRKHISPATRQLKAALLDDMRISLVTLLHWPMYEARDLVPPVVSYWCWTGVVLGAITL